MSPYTEQPPLFKAPVSIDDAMAPDVSAQHILRKHSRLLSMNTPCEDDACGCLSCSQCIQQKRSS